MVISKEEINQRTKVDSLIKEAFANESFSDQTEHTLVTKLRESTYFIPQLSLVATLQNKLVGHILFSRILVNTDSESLEGLALAPVSVLPKYQNQGIGSALINEGHKIAKTLGYKFVILLGHENYYLRFGYKTLQENISLPFPAPRENCFSIELKENSLQHVNGAVEYDKAFGG